MIVLTIGDLHTLVAVLKVSHCLHMDGFEPDALSCYIYFTIAPIISETRAENVGRPFRP